MTAPASSPCRRRFPSSSSSLVVNKLANAQNGVRMATPLLLCTAVIELSDILFAVDSIPAVFGVTHVRARLLV